MQGGFAVAGTTRTSNDPIGEGMYEVKQEAPDVDEGSASGPSEFVAETANEGVKKAGEQAENVGDTAKETMDGNIHEDPAVVEVHKIDDSIDTQEYRSIEEVHKAGGYDKVH